MRDVGTFRIVVGVDGSESSLNALKWAVTEAQLRQGQVRVVTSWQYPPLSDSSTLVVDASSLEQAANTIQIEALEVVDAEGVQVSGQVVAGAPASVLLAAATDADLIVVGSRGRGGFTSLLLGSVSSQVAHHATCPVMIVRAEKTTTATGQDQDAS